MKSITQSGAGKRGNRKGFKQDQARKGRENKIVQFPNIKAYSIYKLEQEVTRASAIDSDRRNAIRNAIVNGYYIANPGQIANKIIDMELGGLSRKK